MLRQADGAFGAVGLSPTSMSPPPVPEGCRRRGGFPGATPEGCCKGGGKSVCWCAGVARPSRRSSFLPAPSRAPAAHDRRRAFLSAIPAMATHAAPQSFHAQPSPVGRRRRMPCLLGDSGLHRPWVPRGCPGMPAGARRVPRASGFPMARPAGVPKGAGRTLRSVPQVFGVPFQLAGTLRAPAAQV